MITQSFPPSASAGVHRPLGFVRNLLTHNWDPVVLTFPEDSYIRRDESLCEKIPDNIKVCRVPYWDNRFLRRLKKEKDGIEASSGGDSSFANRPLIFQIFRSLEKNILKSVIPWLSIPDSLNRWILNAYIAGKKIIREEEVKIIWSTSPINSAHLVGYLLKKYFGIPWVVDLRDPWISSFSDNNSKLHKKINRLFESVVLRNADRIVTVAKQLKVDLCSRYPRLDENKIFVITNGFEENYYEKTKYRPQSVFTITHTGRFYGKRTPISFLHAFKQLLFEEPQIEKKIRIQFIGSFEGRIVEEIKKTGLWDKIKILPQVPHCEVFKYQCESDVLLLVPGFNTLTIPGKFFEYLAAQRPILALTEKNTDSAEIIKETGTGIVVDPKNIVKIKGAIFCLFNKYKNNKLSLDFDTEKAKIYRISSTTKELVSILDDIEN